MKNTEDFTTGRILAPLLRFAVPVVFALFLQAMYGAVDLLIVGRFATSADVSAVSTGSQIMQTFTGLVSSFAMGITVFIGQKIGEGKSSEGTRIIGAGIYLFAVIGIVMSVIVAVLAPLVARIMQAPAEAFDYTVSYIRICGAGLLVIIAYNILGSIFRGFGDADTPFKTVLIACAANIAGDLLLVAVFDMGTAGAAIATVAAQAISVAASVLMVRRKRLLEGFTPTLIRWDAAISRKIVTIGAPIALQDVLVGISFLVILAIVNSLGVIASAGVGVAEKLCTFLMLVPIAFMQAMSAFVAQNRGAGRPDRAVKSLHYSIAVSCAFGFAMAMLSFFHGSGLAGIFASDAAVIGAAAEYLRAYSIDCLLTCFLFCFIGFFNGMERTRFVMLQGIAGAFLVRVPVSFLMSRAFPTSLFAIGLATPCSSVLQILLCLICYHRMRPALRPPTQPPIDHQ